MLEQLIEYYDNGNKSQFAKRLGITPQGVSTWISRNTYDSELLFAKCENVNAEWLLTGEGSMLRTEETPSVMEKTAPSVELISSTKDNTVTIPIVEISVAAGTAGFPNPNYIEVVDGIKLPASMLHRHAQYYCIRVKGDSMAPTILDSSYVVVRLLDRAEWENLRDQHVYVISDCDLSLIHI